MWNLNFVFFGKNEKTIEDDAISEAIDKYEKYKEALPELKKIKEALPELKKTKEEKRKAHLEYQRERIREFVEKLNGDEKVKRLLAASGYSIVLYTDHYRCRNEMHDRSAYPTDHTVDVKMNCHEIDLIRGYLNFIISKRRG